MYNYIPKIEKKDLKHGAYYMGQCRNADVARWNDDRQVFLYWRTKFGHTFLEEIRCPEDEQRYDVFVVEQEIAEDLVKFIPLEIK